MMFLYVIYGYLTLYFSGDVWFPLQISYLVFCCFSFYSTLVKKIIVSNLMFSFLSAIIGFRSFETILYLGVGFVFLSGIYVLIVNKEKEFKSFDIDLFLKNIFLPLSFITIFIGTFNGFHLFDSNILIFKIIVFSIVFFFYGISLREKEFKTWERSIFWIFTLGMFVVGSFLSFNIIGVISGYEFFYNFNVSFFILSILMSFLLWYVIASQMEFSVFSLKARI